MRKLLLLFLFLFSLVTSAQGEANSWYFGNHAGIDFNGTDPIAIYDGQMYTKEG